MIISIRGLVLVLIIDCERLYWITFPVNQILILLKCSASSNLLYSHLAVADDLRNLLQMLSLQIHETLWPMDEWK